MRRGWPYGRHLPMRHPVTCAGCIELHPPVSIGINTSNSGWIILILDAAVINIMRTRKIIIPWGRNLKFDPDVGNRFIGEIAYPIVNIGV